MKKAQLPITDTIQRDFYIIIDPDAFLSVSNNAAPQCFFSIPPQDCPDNFPFIPNQNYRTGAAPFQRNLIKQYRTEYYLEITRRKFFPEFPRRSEVITFFENIQDANVYFVRHESSLYDHVLRKIKTNGKYCYSLHDSSWIDYLNLDHWLDITEIESACKAYWNGQKLKNHKLYFNGRIWTREPIIEVLYFGQAEFYDESTSPEITAKEMFPSKLKKAVEH